VKYPHVSVKSVCISNFYCLYFCRVFVSGPRIAFVFCIVMSFVESNLFFWPSIVLLLGNRILTNYEQELKSAINSLFNSELLSMRSKNVTMSIV
jgi:hypothetical protein